MERLLSDDDLVGALRDLYVDPIEAPVTKLSLIAN